MKLRDIFFKCLLTWLITMYLSNCKAQIYLEECTEHCLGYSTYDTVDLKYATYVGNDATKVKFKTIFHEYSPAKIEILPVRSEITPPNIYRIQLGDTYCYFERQPATTDKIKVVKRPNKYPKGSIEYISLPSVIMRDGEGIECEAICE